MGRYYMLNKPRGLISACTDQRQKTVLSCFPEEDRDGLFHVGRLDKDTEGLLIVTDDGDLCQRLMHPDNIVSKRYLFLCAYALDTDKLKVLREGMRIYSSSQECTRPAEVEILSTQPIEEVTEYLNPVDLKKSRGKKQMTTFGIITITEGKKHQVRRMLRGVGCYVYYLKRVSIGALCLDDTLAPGEYRELNRSDIDLLME